MYYIDRPATWKAANKKWDEVQQYIVGAYSNATVADDKTKDAIIDDIKSVVSKLDKKYPRTKALVVDFSDNYICCYPKGNLSSSRGDYYVFTLQFRPVDKMYNTNTPEGKLGVWVHNAEYDGYTPDLRWMMMRGGEE